MDAFANHVDRAAHLAALRRVALVDDITGAAFDRLARIATRILHAPSALVVLVDEDQQVVKSCVGLPDSGTLIPQSPAFHAFCRELASSGAPLVLADVRDHLAPADATALQQLGVVACAGIPLRTAGGEVLGAFCVCSQAPRVWTSEEMALLTDLAQAVMTEVALQTATHELARREERFRAIWEFAGDAMALSDPAGMVLAANPAYGALYGYTPAEVIGQPFALIFPAAQRETALAGYQATFAAPVITPSVESVIERRDGTQRIVEVRYTFLMDGGRRSAMISLIRDITDRKQAEQERTEILRREQTARTAAEAAVRARDDLLALVTHDLKNPLTSINALMQLLRRRAQRGEAVSREALIQGLTQVEEQVDRMDLLLNDLLDAAQVGAGRPLVFHRAQVDLVALARRVAAEQQQTTPHHRIAVQTHGPAPVGFWDAGRLERVLTNLVANAVKYTPDGGPITVTVGEAAGRASLTVQDTGIGIPPGDLPHVFQPFHRGSNVAGQIRGTGLGLASARAIVEQHGGTITLMSREGQGTTVTVSLPLGPAPGLLAQASEAGPGPADSAP